MLLKLTFIDRFSLQLVANCEIEVICTKFNLKYECDGELEVNLPDDCNIFSISIDAPMYKGVSHIVSSTENNHITIDLEIVDLLEDESVTA